MNKSEILAFINAHPAFQLATAEGDIPHVRSLLLYRADENGIVFMTDKNKDLYKQISQNPKVELCFADSDKMVQIRVSGTLEALEDLELKKEIIATREFLKERAEKGGYGLFAVYRLARGSTLVWTFGADEVPKSYIEL